MTKLLDTILPFVNIFETKAQTCLQARKQRGGAVQPRQLTESATSAATKEGQSRAKLADRLAKTKPKTESVVG